MKLMVIIVAFAFSFLPSDANSEVVDCFGVVVYSLPYSVIFSRITPWMDSAQDTAHYPMHIYSNGPNPIVVGLYGMFSSWFVHFPANSNDLDSILKVWADDLNASFQLQRVIDLNPIRTESFTVDSAYGYTLGPNLWITKAELLALSKKCYIGQFRLPQQPAAIPNRIRVPGAVSVNEEFNTKGQRVKEKTRGAEPPTPTFHGSPR